MSVQSEWEIEELACLACGQTEIETEEIIDQGRVEELLQNHYGIDFDTYHKIVRDLLPFTPQIQTAITGESVHAFVNCNRIIARMEVRNEK